MAKRRTDLAAAKQRKQKIVAIVGVLLLAVLLVVQVPRTMRMLDSGAEEAVPPPPPAETQQPTGEAADAPAEGTETPSAAGSAAPTAAGESLADTDVAPEPDEGDLATFERFSSKDPFVPQVDTSSTAPAAPAPAAPAPAPAATAAAAPTAAAPASTGGPSASPAPMAAATPTASTPTGGQPTAARASAEISINGKPEVVQVRAAFPLGEPTFRLLKVEGDSVRIGIASGGKFTSGAKAMTVRKGKPLTLVNTEDGSRYVLILLSVA